MRLALLLLVVGTTFDYQTPFLDGREQNASSHLDASQFGGMSTAFYLPPSAGWSPSTWGGGITAPTYQWYNVDQDGALGYSWPGTVTGTIESLTSPVCASGTCWTAGKFDGANDFIDASTEWGDPLDQDFAVCAVFYQPATPTGSHVLASKFNGGNAGWMLYSTTGLCRFAIDSGADAVSETQTVINGSWNLCCGFRDYDGNVGVYAQGTIATPTANTTGSVNVAEVVSIGSRYISHDDRMLGYLDWLGIWQGTGTAPVTEAAFDTLNARVFALHPTVGAADVAFTRTTIGCGEDSVGQRQCFGAGVPVLESNGTSIWDGGTNYALNSLDWSAHTDVGTPSYSGNTTSGPASAYAGGAEADTIGDDDGAAYEGKRIVDETTYTGYYSIDAYVAAGTETGASIVITSDGTGSKTCTYTGLDNLVTATSVNGSIQCLKGAACTGSNSYPTGFARLVCSTTIGGVPSATTADLLVGDAIADTGTIIASASEAWRTSYPMKGCPTVGVVASCLGDVASVVTAGTWPIVRGRFAVDVTPARLIATSSPRVIATVNTTGAHRWEPYVTGTSMRWYTINSVGSTDTVIFSLSPAWPAGETRRLTYDFNYASGGVVTLRMTNPSTGALIQQGSNTLPGGTFSGVSATAYLGRLGATTYPFEGDISNVQVQR